MDQSLVQKSAKASVAAQLTTNLLIFSVFLVDWTLVPQALKDVLLLESVSQFIEFCWYATVLYKGWTIKASSRYYDWVISTPLMLVALALFFSYRRGGTVDDDRLALAGIVVFDELMLLCGILMEARKLQVFTAVVTGTVFLIAAFAALSAFVSPDDGLSQGLLIGTMLVWSLYGLAAILPPIPKNTAYNLLDVVSKNGFGIFVTGFVIVEYRK